MSATFKRLIAGVVAGLLSLSVLTTTANAAVSHTAPGRGSATRALPPGVRLATPPPAGAHTLAGHSATAAPADVTSCYDNDRLFSAVSLDYVSAELGYTGDNYGMLRARATAVGPWEMFSFCYDSTTDTWFIKSDANGDYVSAELGYTGDNYGMLRARATAVGPWEQFEIVCAGNNTVAILSLATANGAYVSAELGYTSDNYGMLRARASAIGPWEQFYLAVDPFTGCAGAS